MEIKTLANHSEPLKLDLQFFADEDVILPDDYTETPVDTEDITNDFEVDTNETESLDDIEEETEESQEEEQPEQEEQPKIKVKYNKEEQELSYDDAVPLIQKGMNYDKLQERLQEVENDPRIQFLNELADQHGLNPQEYIEAVRQQQEEQRFNELVQQNIPEELAREILESRRDREERKREKEEQELRERDNQDFADFYEYFNDVNGRTFDAKKDALPEEVIEANRNGVPLKYAYMEHHNNQLQSQVKVLKQNEKNKQTAPIGSVTDHGSQEVASEDLFLQGFNSI
ncbi:hypothetical protein J6TS2_50880 [Heyndrickxia sporothermodurans]|nr:hypothetical protein J6TS2_50880 [Heyndrickxia sporothermodurans]